MTEGIPKKPGDCYRILHTADWHLGKLLGDQSREPEHRRFLAWLLEAIARHEVDALILAGDVFDSANPPQSALTQYFDFVSQLYRQHGCALAVIAGNHDSPAQLEAPKQALEALGAHVVGFLPDDPEKRWLVLPSKEQPRVAIAMIPFLRDRDLRVGRAGEDAKKIRKQLMDGIKARYREAIDAAKPLGLKCPLIAAGHLTVAGSRESTSERGIHIGGLGSVKASTFSRRFDYVALGHLHRPQAAAEDDRVRYSGSPIALSFSECDDEKEVRILDVTADSISDYGLAIPTYRRLTQIHAKAAELKQVLDEFNEPPAELTTWVEVVVTDAAIEDDLNDRVRGLATDYDFEILKVIREKSYSIGGLEAEDPTDDEAVVSLLERPTEVFDHLLEQQPALEDDDKEELRGAFAILLDLHTQADGAETQ